jgi:Poxvirus A32 protein
MQEEEEERDNQQDEVVAIPHWPDFIYSDIEHKIPQIYKHTGWPIEKISSISIAIDGDDYTSQLINVLGRSYSGKTHFIRHLFTKIYNQFDYGVLFNSTDKMTKEYDWIPTKNRYNKWEDDSETSEVGFRTVLKNIMDIQTSVLANCGFDGTPNIFVIIDDPMGTVDFHKSKEFNTIAGQLRKYKVTMFIIHQYFKYISPALRTNFHRMFIFQSNAADLKNVRELLSGFDSAAGWNAFVSKATEDYGGVMYRSRDRKFVCVKAPATCPKTMIQFNYIAKGKRRQNKR